MEEKGASFTTYQQRYIKDFEFYFFIALILLLGDFNSYPINHEFHETCHSVTFYFLEKDSKRCCDITTPESIHTKDESIFGMN